MLVIKSSYGVLHKWILVLQNCQYLIRNKNSSLANYSSQSTNHFSLNCHLTLQSNSCWEARHTHTWTKKSPTRLVSQLPWRLTLCVSSSLEHRRLTLDKFTYQWILSLEPKSSHSWPSWWPDIDLFANQSVLNYYWHMHDLVNLS